MDALRLYLSSRGPYKNIHMLVVCETWATADIPDEVFEVSGYTLLRLDRQAESGKQKGGGIIVYINKQWCKDITIKRKVCTADIELVATSLRPFYLPREFSNLQLLAIYCPPSGVKDKALDIIDSVWNSLESDKPQAARFIIGDANKVNINQRLSHLQQFVDKPTRGSSILDQFFCSVAHSYKCIILPELPNSDHAVVEMIPIYQRLLRRGEVKVIQHKKLSRGSIECLKETFETTDWDVLLNDEGSCDEAADRVIGYIQFCQEMFVETKTKKVFPNDKPWCDRELKQLAAEKHDKHGKDGYREISQRMADALKTKKRLFVSKIEDRLESGDIRQVYSGIKTLLDMEQKNHVKVDNDLGYKLNEFFARFDIQDFSKERREWYATLINKLSVEGHQTNISTSEEEVASILKQINIRKCPGPDLIYGRTLRECRDYISVPIYKLFNRLLQAMHFPSSWKVGIIVPIPKHSLCQNLNDYRPIMLTSIIAKCYEKIIKRALLNEIQNKLDMYQFAYKDRMGTDDALTTFFHLVLQHLDKDAKHYVRVAFLDFSSAFNTIQAHVLMEVLSNLGVSPSICLLILSFMTDRLQHVRTCSSQTSSVIINTGSPQGCILSPILFILYTNSMHSDYESVKIMKYADDTAIVGLLGSATGDDGVYLQAVEKAVAWCNENYLQLNKSKTKELRFDFRRKDSSQIEDLKIDGTSIEQVKEYKYLGVYIDDCLNFDNHTRNVYGRMRKRMWLVKRMKKIGIVNHLVARAFQAFVEPLARYGYTPINHQLSAKNKRTWLRVITEAHKMNLADLWKILMSLQTVENKFTEKIITTAEHPLNAVFRQAKSHSTRNQRCQNMIFCRTSRFRNSLVPQQLLRLSRAV